MTGAELATLIRLKTSTNSTTFTDAEMLVYVNLMKNEIASRIQRVRSNIFDIIYTTDLVASTVTARAYQIPAAALNYIVDLQLKFTSSGDFVKAIHLARHHYKDALQETKIVAAYANDDPRYFITQDKIYILSGTIIAVTGGIKLTYALAPADLADMVGATALSTNSTTANGMPEEFQELWARRVSIEYKDNNDVKLSALELNYKIDLQEALDDFSTESLEGSIIGSLPGTDSDNGFDL